jgi:N6-L-threonylcarbamoyladenine synthase
MTNQKVVKILAIESSCDETAAAVICVENGRPVVLSNVISSQVDLHAKTGGVVPEVASRAHVEAILPVIAEALTFSESGPAEGNQYEKAQAELKSITHIAMTAGPGLIGSLLVGFNAAKTLSYALDLPIIPVNHIEGHIYSVLCGTNNEKQALDFPVLALTASGGHTSLTIMRDHGLYEQIGATIDDAVGEAYDKVAKLLEVGYPGGPVISKLAGEYRSSGHASTIIFPRPIIHDGTFNFSFSGLKTSVLQKVKNLMAELALNRPADFPIELKQELAAAFEAAVADVLATKVRKAVEKYEPKALIFAGGVSANGFLAESIQSKIQSFNIDFMVPERKYCGDNAAMIGIAAYYHLQKGDVKSWQKTKVDSNWDLV